MKWNSTFILLLFWSVASNAQIDHWEMIVEYNAIWKFQKGESSVSGNWRESTFNDAAWASGPGSIGYGDGDDNTLIDPVTSVFMRREFQVVDLEAIDALIFHADYDDAFVAYLNGEEIARSNIMGTNPPFSAWATSLHEAKVYNGGSPEHFFLSPLAWDDLLVEGENILAIQTHNYEGTASSDLTTSYWLSVGLNDSSSNYSETPDWFSSIEFTSPLPILKIVTNGQEIPDEPSINAAMGIVWNGQNQPNSSLGEPNEWFGNISIEKRGQSSLALFPKVGYAIETKDQFYEDMDVSFLNFPEEEDWILHGPYSDKSLIRNDLAMKIAKDMGQYASRTRLVELLINEQYEGVYLLMERIKRDKNRVDIANLKEEDLSGDELTGGYVFKIDKGPTDWESNFNTSNSNQKLKFQFVSPKRSVILVEQEDYIKSYVDSFERSLLDPLVGYGGKKFDDYADIKSFAQHFIHSELTKDVDAYRISSYMFKDKDSNGGLLHAGPVWDFNLTFGNADYCTGESSWWWIYAINCGNGVPFWWGKLVSNQQFANEVNCLWKDYRATFLHLDSINLYINTKTELLDPVVDRNFERWPILDDYIWPNTAVTGSYSGEIEHLRTSIENRIKWMDDNMIGTCISTALEDEAIISSVNIYPNPADNYLLINLSADKQSEVNFEIFNQLGNRVIQSNQHQTIIGNNQFPIDIMHLSSGIYTCRVISKGIPNFVLSFVKI